MAKPRKSLWMLAACAALLSGCATYDYHDDGYYGRTYGSFEERPYRYYEDRPYRYYDYGPTYYYGPRVYAQPSIGFGLSYHRYRRH